MQCIEPRAGANPLPNGLQAVQNCRTSEIPAQATLDSLGHSPGSGAPCNFTLRVAHDSRSLQMDVGTGMVNPLAAEDPKVLTRQDSSDSEEEKTLAAAAQLRQRNFLDDAEKVTGSICPAHPECLCSTAHLICRGLALHRNAHRPVIAGD